MKHVLTGFFQTPGMLFLVSGFYSWNFQGCHCDGWSTPMIKQLGLAFSRCIWPLRCLTHICTRGLESSFGLGRSSLPDSPTDIMEIEMISIRPLWLFIAVTYNIQCLNLIHLFCWSGSAQHEHDMSATICLGKILFPISRVSDLRIAILAPTQVDADAFRLAALPLPVEWTFVRKGRKVNHSVLSRDNPCSLARVCHAT